MPYLTYICCIYYCVLRNYAKLNACYLTFSFMYITISDLMYTYNTYNNLR